MSYLISSFLGEKKYLIPIPERFSTNNLKLRKRTFSHKKPLKIFEPHRTQ